MVSKLLFSFKNHAFSPGFQKDMKQLPGLIKPERDSLSLVCLILYKSYLLKKTQHQDFKEEVSNYIK